VLKAATCGMQTSKTTLELSVDPDARLDDAIKKGRRAMRLDTQTLARWNANAFAGLIHPADYRHLKSGEVYELVACCLREADLEPCVLYRDRHGVSWVRPLAEFQQRFALLHQNE
jgi:hypothetical protein